MGVWIETWYNIMYVRVYMSHPAWVCGLKRNGQRYCYYGKVTPCVGVWIETKGRHKVGILQLVTPCVGVWIETENRDEVGQDLNVTPCVGVWIETENQQKPYTTLWVTPCVGVWIETENILYDFLLS